MSNDRSTPTTLQAQRDALQDENEHLRQQVADLRQNQERLHYALEGSNAGIWDWLIPENQAVLSERYREMLGYNADELPNSVDSWLNSIHPDDMAAVRQTLEDYLAGQHEEYILEHRLRHKSGEWRWMLSRGKVVVRDEAGQPLRMTGTITDITERKEREFSEQQLSTLVDTISDFVGFAMLDGTAGYVNAAGRRLLGLDLDHDISTVSIEQFHPPEDIAFLHETILPAVQEQGEWRGEFRFRHFQTGDIIPISLVLFRVKNPQTDQVDRLGCLARDITEQKQTEANMQRLVAIVENSLDFVATASFEGDPVYISPAGLSMVGLESMEQAQEYKVIDFYPDANRPAFEQEIMPAVMRDGFWQGEFRFRNIQTDAPIPVHFTIFLVKEPATGTPLGIGTVTRDITQQKQQQEAIQMFKTLVDNAPDAISVANLEGVEIYANPVFQERTGYGEQVIGMHIPELYNESVETINQVVHHVMKHGFWQGENNYRHRDGHSVTNLASIFLVRDDADNPRYIAAIEHDLTEQKRQQAEVSVFKTMADTAPDGFGMADADGTLTYANAAYRDLTGYGDALVGMNFLDHFTETDRVLALEALSTTAEEGGWHGVLNFQRQDGSIIPVDSKGFVTRDEAGNIAAVMGLFRDLREQYRQEEERAALQQQVIDAQRDALRELSTPLIPLSDNVVIMPLIGTIDSQRAQQVMEALLEGVAVHQAELVILDITGVSVVDTQVAQAFIQAAQAVRLLGAQVMLTGIQPQIAQTLVHLGVDLSGIQTRGSLQVGISVALAQH